MPTWHFEAEAFCLQLDRFSKARSDCKRLAWSSCKAQEGGAVAARRAELAGAEDSLSHRPVGEPLSRPVAAAQLELASRMPEVICPLWKSTP